MCIWECFFKSAVHNRKTQVIRYPSPSSIPNACSHILPEVCQHDSVNSQVLRWVIFFWINIDSQNPCPVYIFSHAMVKFVMVWKEILFKLLIACTAHMKGEHIWMYNVYIYTIFNFLCKHGMAVWILRILDLLSLYLCYVSLMLFCAFGEYNYWYHLFVSCISYFLK